MAACDLTLELSEPQKVYTAGDTVRGEVLVRVEKQVQCKGLVLSTFWATHGRGNVDRGEVDSAELFSGTWQPGEYRYPFELRTASWPPTYHGTLLNVSHHVQAQAKVPWAFDPKTSEEITVWATTSPADLSANDAKKARLGPIGWTVVAVLLSFLGLMLFAFIPLLLLVGGSIWFFMSFLPKLRTGPVECQLAPLRVKAGQPLLGTMEFTPRLNTKINGVTVTLAGEEKCVSGSGSNRRTHTHALHSQQIQLLDAGRLTPGVKQAFRVDLQLPANAPPSLDLSDNDLNWHVEFRIDIPLWPDFAKKIPLLVEPAPQELDGPQGAGQQDDATWLDQVIEQLLKTSSDPEHLGLVLDAIEGDAFEITLEIAQPTTRPILAEHLAGGTWLQAFDPEHELPARLHVPAELNVAPGSQWRGRIAIIGFDVQHSELIATALETT
ncbi:MAG: hypothetical protein KDA45_07975 [Planctomycetales bacterium]|nr:hypothetical protein [Planctomycetales bacterium]